MTISVRIVILLDMLIVGGIREILRSGSSLRTTIPGRMVTFLLDGIDGNRRKQFGAGRGPGDGDETANRSRRMAESREKASMTNIRDAII
jgi:hypothetical protein